MRSDLHSLSTMIDAQEDIDVFFDAGDSGTEQVVYNKFGGAPATIVCRWDEPYGASIVEGLEVRNIKPSALFRTIDVPNANDQDTVVRNSVTYYVMDVQPDGTGVTRLIFSKDSP